MVGRLEKRQNLLLRNKQKSEVDVLFNEPFCGVHREPVAEDDALSKERAKTEELTMKLQHLSVRNVNKRIKRQDLKIAESQAQVNEMDRGSLRIRLSANLKLTCIQLKAQFIVSVKDSIGLKIRLKLQPVKPLTFKPNCWIWKNLAQRWPLLKKRLTY